MQVKTLVRRLAILCVILGLVGMNACQAKKGKSAWTEEKEAAYLEDCIKEVSQTAGNLDARAYCSCSLGKVKASFPRQTLVEELPADSLARYTRECMAAQGIDFDAINTPQDLGQAQVWTATTKVTFMTICEEQSKQIGVDFDVKQYCQCSMNKVIKAFPDPRDADRMSDTLAIGISESCLKEMGLL